MLYLYTKYRKTRLTVIAWNLPHNYDSGTIHKPRASGRSFTPFEKVIFKPAFILCNKERKPITAHTHARTHAETERGVWTTEATAVLECQSRKTVLGTAENEKGWNGFDLFAAFITFLLCARVCVRVWPVRGLHICNYIMIFYFNVRMFVDHFCCKARCAHPCRRDMAP